LYKSAPPVKVVEENFEITDFKGYIKLTVNINLFAPKETKTK